MICDGEVIEKHGYTFRVNFEQDDDQGPPWENEDGHGPVSDWEERGKRPGEWVLNKEYGSKRFYDAADAMRIAKRDGWGLSDEAKGALLAYLIRHNPKRGTGPLTPGEIRAEAVARDFDFLRRWCQDDWHYCGVIVTHIPDPDEDRAVATDYTHALWGIEDDQYEYLEQVAHDLIDECLHELERADLGLRFD